MFYKVYLAGQMAPDPRTHIWRDAFSDAMKHIHNVGILDPSTNEAFPKGVEGKEAIAAAHASSYGKIIMPKDRAMVKEANIIVANLNHYDHDKLIAGTLFELAWAYDDSDTTVIVVGTPLMAGPLLNHPFVTSTADIIVDTVEDAIHLVQWISGALGKIELK